MVVIDSLRTVRLRTAREPNKNYKRNDDVEMHVDLNEYRMLKECKAISVHQSMHSRSDSRWLGL